MWWPKLEVGENNKEEKEDRAPHKPKLGRQARIYYHYISSHSSKRAKNGPTLHAIVPVFSNERACQIGHIYIACTLL